MQSIDPRCLSALQPRVTYLKFSNFTKKDVAALHAARHVVQALIPTVVETVYKKLLSYNITGKEYVPT